MGVDSNPLSLNRYTYCHNNPISYVDPSGHIIVTKEINGGIISFNTEQFVSSEIDYKFWSELKNADDGEIDIYEFINRAAQLGITVNNDGTYRSSNYYDVVYSDTWNSMDVSNYSNSTVILDGHQTDSIIDNGNIYVKASEVIRYNIGVAHNGKYVKSVNGVDVSDSNVGIIYDGNAYIKLDYIVDKMKGINSETISWWGEGDTFIVSAQGSDYTNSDVVIIRRNENILIDTNVSILGAVDNVVIADDGTSTTYKDMVKAGIAFWGNTYNSSEYDYFGNYDSVNVAVVVNESRKRDAVKIFVDNDKFETVKKTQVDWDNNGAIYHTVNELKETYRPSVWWNSSYGWHPTGRGEMTLYRISRSKYSEISDAELDGTAFQGSFFIDEYTHTVAHEFGHILGIDDAYGEGTRPEVKLTPETQHTIMHSNKTVTANDIEMMLEAWRTGVFQSFVEYESYRRFEKSKEIRCDGLN